jgi:cytidylate kinase
MANTDHPKKSLIIAIDGYSSCGKSTLAKQVAKELGYVFVDTGAMYRAVTLYFLDNNIDLEDADAVLSSLDNIHIKFENTNGHNTTFLNGENVESKIRSLRVSQMVSEVAAISSVRRKLVDLQRSMSRHTGLVMDGRDIGTVVFPNADIKVFVTADPMIRAQRRYQELLQNNQHADLHEVMSNLSHRDEIDTSRDDSPLRQADDAVVLDNSNFTVEEQFQFVMDLVDEKLGM